MNKQKKNIIIAACVLAILLVGVLAVWLILPALEPDPSEEPVNDVVIFDFDSAFIERVDFLNPVRGGNYSVCKGYKAGSVFYYIENDPFESRQSYFVMTLDMIASLDGGKLVETSPSDLSKYGIKDENAAIVISRTNATEKDRITFGDFYPLDGSYVYAYVSTTDSVYTISSSVKDTLSSASTYYREINIVPDLTEETFTELKSYQCILPDGYVLAFERSPEGSFAAFTETKPKQGAVDNYNVSSRILNKLLTISAITVVEDNPKDLAQYGLKNPIKIVVDYMDGGRYTLHIGAMADDFIFVMMEGVPTVLAATGDFSFVDVRGEDILDTGLFMFPIKDISQAVFHANNKDYVFVVDDRTDENGEGEFSASFQGKPMKEADARSLYAGMLSFYAVGSYTKTPPADTQYSLTFTMRDGTTNKLELRKINSRQYAAVVNGTCNSYVSITAVNHLLDLIDKVEKGESIENIF